MPIDAALFRRQPPFRQYTERRPGCGVDSHQAPDGVEEPNTAVKFSDDVLRNTSIRAFEPYKTQADAPSGRFRWECDLEDLRGGHHQFEERDHDVRGDVLRDLPDAYLDPSTRLLCTV